MIAIHPPFFLNEQGKRKSNQDNIYPLPGAATVKDRLFMVCDGVGGSQRGDLASMLVCKYLPEFFLKNPVDSPEPVYLDQALEYTESKLEQYISQNTEAAQTATTLTMLHIGEKGCAVAWVGDSRVYHLDKRGNIKYRTKDHSLVQAMIESGELTEENARSFQKKNIILKAINPGKGRTSLESYFIPADKIDDGDYFLLCSDGIWEFVDSRFGQIIGKAANNQSINETIKGICQEHSKDNFSSYLIQIKYQQQIESQRPKILNPVKFAKPQPENAAKNLPFVKTKTGIILIAASVIFLLLLMGAALIVRFKNTSAEKEVAAEIPASLEPSESNDTPVSQVNEIKSGSLNRDFTVDEHQVTEQEVPQKPPTQNSGKKPIEDASKMRNKNENIEKEGNSQKSQTVQQSTFIPEANSKKESVSLPEKNIEAEKNQVLFEARNALSKKYYYIAKTKYKAALDLEADSKKKIAINNKIQACDSALNLQEAQESLILKSNTAVLKKELAYFEYKVQMIFENIEDRAISINFAVDGGHYKDCEKPGESHIWISRDKKTVNHIIPALSTDTVNVKLINLIRNENCPLYFPSKKTKDFDSKKFSKEIRFIER